jgi:hypothetical protein
MFRRFLVLVPAALALSLAAVMTLSQPASDDAVPPNPELRWYKGNLHTHSLWSDGNDYPEMIAEWYRTNGYHFLALSDHNILSEGEKWVPASQGEKRGAVNGLERYRARFGNDWVETREVDGKTEVRLKTLNEFRPLVEERGKFLMIQSEEITDHFESLPVHINAHNLRDVIKPQGGTSVRETIAKNLEAVENQSQRIGRPILAHLNHPNFHYGVTAEDLAAVLAEHFFEVYNGHPGVNHQGDHLHAGVGRLWDIANTIRIAELKAPPLMGLATDDAHNHFGHAGSSPGRGWVMVRAKRLTAESLIAALERGDFYASSGVSLKEVRYSPEARTLELQIEPTNGEEYTTQFIGTLEGFDPRSEAVVDDSGKTIQATRRYSADVGRVLATVPGTKPRYELTGRELYVRAVVTSTAPPENPAFKDQRKQAWTQPVGWEGRVDK